MGSSSKKSKDKDRKRRHSSRSSSLEREYREKKHRHHKKHHKEKKKEKIIKQYEYESDSSDVIEVIPDEEASTPPPPKIQCIHSPEIGHGQSSESLSVDETNKLRAKLGLKPLHIDSKSDKSSKQKEDGKRKDDLGEFYHKPAVNIATKHQQEKIREKLTQHKEKRHLDQKLSKVKLLGEADSDIDDTLKWIEKNKKIVKARQEAEKRAKMLEELDAQFGVGEVVESEQRLKRNLQYTEKNLHGLEVEHDTENFKEGQTIVLTLKDKDVLDEDADVLVNVNLLEDERYKKNVENKKQKPDYNPYDIEDIDEFGNLKTKSLLSKYDEEIEGTKKNSFRIGFDNAAERRQVIMNTVKEKLANKRLESLQTPELTIASDYYSEQELAKFKKPKKKIKKLRSKPQTIVSDPEGSKFYTRRPKIKEDTDTIITDDVPAVDIKPDIKVEEDIDDTLERALHKARKLKQKEAITTNSFTSVSGIKDEPQEDGLDPGAIVLNTTAEFCRTLGDIPTYGKSGNREDTEDLLDYEKDAHEDVEMDMEAVEETTGGWNAVDPNRSQEVSVVAPFEVPILDEEPDVGSGVGAALKLAMSKGYLEKEDKARPSNSKLAHLQAQHYSIEDKSYGEDFDRGARRERYTGPIMDFKERDAFKPNVKLEYIDDEGHVLNAKEAFRYLSHKFHGKGPGKNKIEKRLKKQQQEGLMKKMSSTDTPLGTLNMLQAKQKEMQSPFIVLSGGKHTHSTTISKPRN
ncbi:U4/U6.U5 tri-snRNP-associated protein 1 isoform X2 [Agrilus planipennis]|uniref:U4/U6.U5 tri-snRNP-associated protein 1 isoform X1 n=1 Tax=Agrilus planipennis TaxID=224129 RepID=A0A1W4XBE8_AGRPL|nr:U4/U6.U5 tri-snRNP-associated protein 1 isoform X1 [Agrilus planipennis]XP_018330147.1 U4/U6.U5 tri-snRNP-associated protein 1 isoform X2 [Agrilus planipennis]